MNPNVMDSPSCDNPEMQREWDSMLELHGRLAQALQTVLQQAQEEGMSAPVARSSMILAFADAMKAIQESTQPENRNDGKDLEKIINTTIEVLNITWLESLNSRGTSNGS